ADGGDFPVSVPSAWRATLGYLVVWEDRAARTATIRLPVAVVHAMQDSGADPVLFLTGGPGSGSLAPAAFPGAYPWTENRDFIALGQRGTQHALPSLECPEIEGAFSDSYLKLTGRERDARLAAGAAACRSRLEASGVDLSAYHTDAITEDVVDLAQVLGEQSLTLFGLSYGTRVALDLARDHPELVSAMVLDSPLPPDVRYDDESARNFRRSLEGIAADCATLPACSRSFPDLRARFFAALRDAESDPITLSLDDGMGRVDFDGARLAALVNTGSPGGIRAAPLAMHMIASGDTSRIRSLVSTAYTGSDFAWGMRLSVWCSEAWPFSERASASGPDDALFGYESAAVAPVLCETWRVPARPEEFVNPVASRVPTLLIAGEFDPATPPSWAIHADRLLAYSVAITIPGGGHTPSVEWGGDGCAMSLAAGFVSDPARFLAGEIVPDCLGDTERPEYQLRPSSER
ncbi:MAG: alpha/beta fold hydrolase, partial [Gemmatimonadetes bacterium]|nr:alpha/beta fold hydrolase [Gemmatimonadota bacterium]